MHASVSIIYTLAQEGKVSAALTSTLACNTCMYVPSTSMCTRTRASEKELGAQGGSELAYGYSDLLIVAMTVLQPLCVCMCVVMFMFEHCVRKVRAPITSLHTCTL
jgi:hypothetical protein